MDQSWVMALPFLGGILLVGTSLSMYRSGERFLKDSLLLAAFGPGVITAPLGIGISWILVPIAFFLWPVAWARDFIMAVATLTFLLGWLSFAWSPKWILPRWLRSLVVTPSWIKRLSYGVRKARGLTTTKRGSPGGRGG
jgi:hypothetical protein